MRHETNSLFIRHIRVQCDYRRPFLVPCQILCHIQCHIVIICHHLNKTNLKLNMVQLNLHYYLVMVASLCISLLSWSATTITAFSYYCEERSSRRTFLERRTSTSAAGVMTVASILSQPQASCASSPTPPSLTFSASTSGIQWADAKVGSGPTPKFGDSVSIDYVLSTTGARYGSLIYKTSDKGAPYRWELGDGSTIRGLEEAIVGSEGMPPMEPGGIRRVIIPPALAYEKLKNGNQECGMKGTFGPVPPSQDAFEEFQRFKNIYCNPDRQYQPDVVIDIKLYGKRMIKE